MGQNIHMHIEVKHDGRWQHYAAPHVARNYTLYGLLGSERALEDVEPLRALKVGVPVDASEVTSACLDMDRQDYGPGVYRNARWLDADGIVKLQAAWHLANPGKTPQETDLESTVLHTYISGNAIAAHYGFEDVRLIWWFDN